MFLTRFPLNLSRRETRSMLASPYRLHAAIAASFPPQEASGAKNDGRVLWRVDRMTSGGAVIYIASPGQPSLIGLDEQVGWPDLNRQWETRPYDRFLESLENGQRWAFRLVANPIVSRSGIKNGRGQSKRIGHATMLQQEAWLIGKDAYRGIQADPSELFARNESSRAERNGFRVTVDSESGLSQLLISESRKVSFKGGGGRRISLSVARYDGILEIVDSTALRHALVNGIGHAKGFGCGLMTLAPVRAR